MIIISAQPNRHFLGGAQKRKKNEKKIKKKKESMIQF
jgi:hypothetical protein